MTRQTSMRDQVWSRKKWNTSRILRTTTATTGVTFGKPRTLKSKQDGGKRKLGGKKKEGKKRWKRRGVKRRMLNVKRRMRVVKRKLLCAKLRRPGSSRKKHGASRKPPD